MQMFHDTWRENVGSILIGAGVIALLSGLGSMTLAEHGFLPSLWEWLLAVSWPFAIGAGFWLHVTRSRRRVNIHAPPPETTQQEDQSNHLS